MVVRFVCLIRVPVCPVSVPAPTVSFYRYPLYEWSRLHRCGSWADATVVAFRLRRARADRVHLSA